MWSPQTQGAAIAALIESDCSSNQEPVHRYKATVQRRITTVHCALANRAIAGALTDLACRDVTVRIRKLSTSVTLVHIETFRWDGGGALAPSCWQRATVIRLFCNLAGHSGSRVDENDRAVSSDMLGAGK